MSKRLGLEERKNDNDHETARKAVSKIYDIVRKDNETVMDKKFKP